MFNVTMHGQSRMFVKSTIIDLKFVTMSVKSCVELGESLSKVRVLTSFFLVAQLTLCNIDYVFVLTCERSVQMYFQAVHGDLRVKVVEHWAGFATRTKAFLRNFIIRIYIWEP